jgi:2-phosphosulfolactate phosphatase
MIQCEWGLAGIEALRPHVSVLVIVDVLSFSTAVDIAVARGTRVLPFSFGDEDAARRAAEAAGAELAKPRQAGGAQLSLSPASLTRLEAGNKLLLPSPNGSRLSLAGGDLPVLAGSLRNAAAVAAAALALAGGGNVGIIPAGERWPDGSLRPAIEDLVGAGAIVDALDQPLDAEARMAREAFRSAGAGLAELVRSSRSGRELIERGFAEDVEMAVALNVSMAVPLLRDGAYVNVAGARD